MSVNTEEKIGRIMLTALLLFLWVVIFSIFYKAYAANSEFNQKQKKCDALDGVIINDGRHICVKPASILFVNDHDFSADGGISIDEKK